MLAILSIIANSDACGIDRSFEELCDVILFTVAHDLILAWYPFGPSLSSNFSDDSVASLLYQLLLTRHVLETKPIARDNTVHLESIMATCIRQGLEWSFSSTSILTNQNRR
jgi:hypothetical protein